MLQAAKLTLFVGIIKRTTPGEMREEQLVKLARVIAEANRVRRAATLGDHTLIVRQVGKFCFK
jgi:hypothetical protein